TEPAARDVPDLSGRRVVVAAPWRGRLGRARDGGDGKDQREGGEPAGHEFSIPRGVIASRCEPHGATPRLEQPTLGSSRPRGPRSNKYRYDRPDRGSLRPRRHRRVARGATDARARG